MRYLIEFFGEFHKINSIECLAAYLILEGATLKGADNAVSKMRRARPGFAMKFEDFKISRL